METSTKNPVTAPDELRLARAAARGDSQAFAQLYERYQPRIYAYCRRMLRCPDDAGDATQEAFANVMQRLPAIDGAVNFGPYMFTAARNASLRIIDRRRRTEPVDEVPEPAQADPTTDHQDAPEHEALRQAHAQEVREAEQELPGRHREVLALREVDGLSYEEIALSMGLKANAVAQLLLRARGRLRSQLAAQSAGAIAASGEGCDRALGLLLEEHAGRLNGGGAWLQLHLSECAPCRLRREAVQETTGGYRAWAGGVVALLSWLRSRAARAATGRPRLGRVACAGGAVAAVGLLAAAPVDRHVGSRAAAPGPVVPAQTAVEAQHHRQVVRRPTHATRQRRAAAAPRAGRRRWTAAAVPAPAAAVPAATSDRVPHGRPSPEVSPKVQRGAKLAPSPPARIPVAKRLSSGPPPPVEPPPPAVAADPPAPAPSAPSAPSPASDPAPPVDGELPPTDPPPPPPPPLVS